MSLCALRHRLALAILTTGLAGLLAACDSQVAGVARTFDQGLSACTDLDNGSAAASFSRPGTAPHVKVLLFRGLDDVFSLGLDTLQQGMSNIGLDASVYSGNAWSTVGAQVASARALDPNPPDLVIIGHSYGADDGIRLATYLRSRNVPVRLLILLDATSPPPIPDNVIYCLHLYNLWLPGYLAPGIFSGNPVEPAAGNARTIIKNEVVTPNPSNAAVGCVNHFNIDASTHVHQRIIDEIYKLAD